MTDEATSWPDMRDLMATVGEVLLLWGFLESAIRDRLAALSDGKATNKSAPLLTMWQHAEQAAVPNDPRLRQLVEDIATVAAIRNTLAHGLSSASADPHGFVEPRVVCHGRDGASIVYPLSSLEQAKQQIHDVRLRVQNR